MIKKSYLNFWLLLLCMIVGVGSAWAEEVKYSITAKNTLSVSGTAPTGSSATIVETYGTSMQMTSGNSQTLTLRGYDGYKITKLVMSMKSNAQKGAGKLSYSIDGGTTFSYIIVGSSNSGVGFNQGAWHGSWSTTYVDITKSGLDISCSSSDVIIKIEATANSLYCESYTITYEAVASVSPLSSIALSGTYPTSFYVGDEFSHEGMTVTANYEDNSNNDVTSSATFSGYDMDNAGNQTVTVSYTEGDVTKTADYGITVSERPKFTVTFSDGGSVTEANAGAGVTLPSRTAIGDYTFAGWSTTNVNTETTTAPTIIPAGSYEPADNITLYPVYTRTEGGGAVVDEWVEIFEVPTDGYYAICSDSYFMAASIKNSRFANGSSTPSINEGKLTVAPADDCIWNIYKAADDCYRIKNGNNFAAATGSNNQGELLTAESGDYAKWTVTYSNGFVIENVGMASASKNKTLRNNGTYGWASYGATTGDAPRLFKKISQASSTTYYFSAPVAATVERPVITLAENPFLFSTTATITCATDGATIYYSYDNETWNEYTEALKITATTAIYAKATKGGDESAVDSMTATKNLAEPTVTISGDLTVDLNGETSVDAGTLTAAVTYNEAAVEGATVTWSGNNDAVATIDASTGAVSIKTCGTVSFTATYAGNDDYAEATATKEITVINSKAPGSVGNPYTVAQAIENTPTSGTSDKVYISGIVSAFYNTSIVGDGSNYRYYISDDGTTTNQLLVYKGKGLNDVAFSNASDLQIGDKVVIYGRLTTYNKAAEIASGNYISSLTRKAEAGLSFANAAYEVRLGNVFDAPALVNPNSLSPITWESSDEAVATVDSEGAVTVKAVGTTTITAKFAGNEGYKGGEASYELSVINDKLDAGLELVEASISMNAGTEKDISELFTVTSDGTVTYESDKENVAKVSGGKLVVVAPGEAIITINVAETDDYKAASKDVTVTVTALPGVEPLTAEKVVYQLVTDVSTLKEGNELIIVNSDTNGEAQAMGGQNTNNRGIVDVNISGAAIEDINDAQVITLEGTSDKDKWYFNVGTDSYLYAASSSSNYLKTASKEDVGDNGKATILISSNAATITFQGTNTRNSLRYNSSSKLFSCYSSSSGQDKIYLYRKATVTADYVTVTIGDAGWRTLVSAKNVSFPAEVNAYIVTAEDGEKAKLKKVNAVKANVPVLMQGDAGNYQLPVVEDEACANTADNMLRISETDTFEDAFVLAKKEGVVGFYKWTGGWMGAGRVYLPVVNNAAREFIDFEFVDDTTTGISQMAQNEKLAGTVYNMNGQRVQTMKKGGLYVVDGKKVFINK